MLKCTAIGFIGNDAEIKEINGKKVVNFSFAHTETWKNNAGVKSSRTIWIECAAWEKQNLAPFLKKGTQIYVEGQAFPNAWVDKETAEVKATLRMKVFQIQLLGKKEKEQTDTTVPEEEGEVVDGLPF